MTVIRTGKQLYRTDTPTVAACVRNVFQSKTIYTEVIEDTQEDVIQFRTIIQPSVPLVLSTIMTVVITNLPEQTSVELTTRSQQLIVGDLFGLYDSYIRAFLTDLKKCLPTDSAADSSLRSVQPKRLEINWYAFGLLTFAMSIVLVYIVIFIGPQLVGGIGNLSIFSWFYISLFALLAILGIWNLLRALRH